MTDIHAIQRPNLPGSELNVAKMPGHWLLARLVLTLVFDKCG